MRRNSDCDYGGILFLETGHGGLNSSLGPGSGHKDDSGKDKAEGSQELGRNKRVHSERRSPLDKVYQVPNDR